MKKVMGISTPKMHKSALKSGPDKIMPVGKVGGGTGYRSVSCGSYKKGKMMKSGKGTGAM